MNRRSQLLQEKPLCKDVEMQLRYFKLRSELLRRRYGTCADTSSIPSEKSFDQVKNKSRVQIVSSISKKSATAAESFGGVHHVFDQHTAAISILKFANNDRSRFCCASLDSTISICESSSSPPKVICKLQAHEKRFT